MTLAVDINADLDDIVALGLAGIGEIVDDVRAQS